MNSQQSWRSYEDVACYLLNSFRQEFGLECVDPKQKVLGSSGTWWAIDAKGIREGDNSGLVIVECRQYRSKRLSQEAVGGLAYRITDIGASGGITVSPLPLQDGAKKVAEANNIVHVQLGPDSTPENFAISFLNKIFLGISDQVTISDHVNAVIIDKDGNKKSY